MARTASKTAPAETPKKEKNVLYVYRDFTDYYHLFRVRPKMSIAVTTKNVNGKVTSEVSSDVGTRNRVKQFCSDFSTYTGLDIPKGGCVKVRLVVEESVTQNIGAELASAEAYLAALKAAATPAAS